MRETYSLHSQGLSIKEIARRRNCTTGTIEGHLVECLRAEFPVDVARLVSDSDRAQIEKAIAATGAGRLKPIRDSLPESITYNMIRFVIADLQRAMKAKAWQSEGKGQRSTK